MSPERVYAVNPEFVAREIDDEMIIVPIANGVGKMQDALYTLNETGKEVWRRIDGTRSIGAIIGELRRMYEGEGDRIEADVLELVAELKRHDMLIEVDGG